MSEKLEFIIKEILDIESQYVDKLKRLNEEFLIPSLRQTGLSLKKPKVTVFLEIFNTNQLSHTTLNEKLSNQDKTKCLEERLIQLCDFYRLAIETWMIPQYANYYCVFDDATKVLKDILESKTFKKEFNSLKSRSNSNDLKLMNLLDMMRIPHQHVFKYKLLFDRLNSNNNFNGECKESTQLLVEAINVFVNHLNQVKKDRENMNLVQEKFSKYDENIKKEIESSGSLIYKCEALVDNHSKRLVAIFDECIYLFSCKNKKLKGKIFLNNLTDVCIITPEIVTITDKSIKQIVFTCKNKTDKDNLYLNIDKAFKKTFANGYNSNNHLFSLKNYKNTVTYCLICKNILIGILYQGHECSNCGLVCHSECIINAEKCINYSKRPIKRSEHASYINRDSISSKASTSTSISNASDVIYDEKNDSVKYENIVKNDYGLQEEEIKAREDRDTLKNAQNYEENEIAFNSNIESQYQNDVDNDDDDDSFQEEEEEIEEIKSELKAADRDSFKVRQNTKQEYEIVLKANKESRIIPIKQQVFVSSQVKPIIYYYLNRKRFENLNELIQYYTKNDFIYENEPLRLSGTQERENFN